MPPVTSVIMIAFRYFLAAVWLSCCIDIIVPLDGVTNVPLPPFTGGAHERVIFSNYLNEEHPYIKPTSGISWVTPISNWTEYCGSQGIIRLPFNSSSCYKFVFTFLHLTGFNFHISNGCGDGWGGTSGCYEVHNYKSIFYVYGKPGSGDRTRLINAVQNWVIAVTIEKGKVQFRNYLMNEIISNPTLFTSSYVYFSMNRVYNLKAYPNPPRVATGLCSATILSC